MIKISKLASNHVILDHCGVVSGWMQASENSRSSGCDRAQGMGSETVIVDVK